MKVRSTYNSYFREKMVGENLCIRMYGSSTGAMKGTREIFSKIHRYSTVTWKTVCWYWLECKMKILNLGGNTDILIFALG